jgi:hypothetical protein
VPLHKEKERERERGRVRERERKLHDNNSCYGDHIIVMYN